MIGFWMFPVRRFVFWARPPRFIGSFALVFKAYLDAAEQYFRWPSGLSGVYDFMANLEEEIAVPTLPVGDQRHVASTLDYIFKHLYCKKNSLRSFSPH